MAIDRIQPPSDRSPQWNKNDTPAAERREAARPNPVQHTDVNQAAHAAQQKAKAGTPQSVNHTQSLAENAAEKIKALQQQCQTEIKLTSVSETLAAARQELTQASQEHMAGVMETDLNASYWQKLDVVEKARAINRLKDKVQDLELQRRDLVESLSRQVRSGTYQVTGAEIAQGMVEEMS